jgi:Zinc-binding loop region of homing endonuclease
MDNPAWWSGHWLSTSVRINQLNDPSGNSLIKYLRWHMISWWIHNQHDPQARAKLSACKISTAGQGHLEYNLSHRCHFKGCANPAHLEIETHNDNSKRNDCQGRVRYIIIGPNNQVYQRINPCPHRDLTRQRKECVLPEIRLSAAGNTIGLPHGYRGAGQI